MDNSGNALVEYLTDVSKLPKAVEHDDALKAIVDDLRYFTSSFPMAAIKDAIAHQHDITPLLLNVLNETIENYSSLKDDEMGAFYAVHLLAQFRETNALPLIIQLASLPEDATDQIFGDSITENLHKIIASVYKDDVKPIQQFIENPVLCTWSRNAGIKALLVLVKQGRIERNQVIDYFKELFNHPTFINDSMAITHLVSASCDVYPAELYDEIKMAFERYRVDTSVVTMAWVESILAIEEPDALKKYFNTHYDFIDDTIDELHHWACFEEKSTPRNTVTHAANRSGSVLPRYAQKNAPNKTIKVGRNALCPCGSNRKFKKCCLAS